MSCRLSPLALTLVLLVTPSLAKEKKKPILPAEVLQARTARVIIYPDAGEPIIRPRANETARTNVEKALMEWGRFDIVPDGQESDLVFVVRTGNGTFATPTVKGGPIDQRPGVAEGTDNSIRIGAQQGHPPADETGAPPTNTPPYLGNESGPAEDMLEVYRGNVQDPLDFSPVFRHIAKDCLKAPKVAGVEEFRKAVAAAEKPQVTKKP